MPKVRLTEQTIKKTRPGDSRIELWDAVVPNLQLRVSPAGGRTFHLRYYKNGRRRAYKIGSFPEVSLRRAREKAREVLGEAATGGDPQEERRRENQGAGTLGELASEYIEKHAKAKKKSWAEDERMLQRDVLPRWKHRQLDEIDRREISFLLDRIVERNAPVQANRVRSLLSKMFNFGIGRGLLEINPVLHVERPAKELPRQRVLSEDELRTIWRTLEGYNPIVAATYKLRLLTAQRGVEVRAMRWSNIEGNWWTIPAEVAKNSQQHRIPLSPETLEILAELRPLTGRSDWVLESPTRPGIPVGKLQKANARLRAASGIDFRPHDLRRTAASLMTGAGTSRLVVSKILNHAERGVTAVYDRYGYDKEKREALLAWGREVARIVSKGAKSAKVIQIAG